MVNDSTLQTLVMDELNWEPSVNAAHIGVSVNNGVVTLSGFVDHFAARKDRVMRNALSALCLTIVTLAACAPKQQPQAAASAQPVSTVTPGTQEDLVGNVGDRVFFDFDKSNLEGHGPRTGSNMNVLTRQVAWLKTYGKNAVQIAGNCDERGTEEYNLALGERRARAVRSYMVANGIAPARVTTISYGKERPVALDSTEDAWSQNRNAITSVK